MAKKYIALVSAQFDIEFEDNEVHSIQEQAAESVLKKINVPDYQIYQFKVIQVNEVK